MPESFAKDFRRFFVRGLAAVLPTILTVAIIIYVVTFVHKYISSRIADGIQTLVNWGWIKYVDPQSPEDWSRINAAMDQFWSRWDLVFQVLGFLAAIVLIYVFGRFVGSFIGRGIWRILERFLVRLPVIKQIYPSVKQVTDFLFSDQKVSFSNVVAVEYPRKGIWSLGFVTSPPMKEIAERTGADMVTVFIPSSPTPVTGYTITVLREDTVPLPITVDEALRFTISAGVITPSCQQLPSRPGGEEHTYAFPAEASQPQATEGDAS